MASIDSGLPPITPDILRMEFRQQVGGNALDKPSFGQKLGMFFAKGFNWIGKIAKTVLPFFGPLGMVGSAAAYGIEKFTGNAIDKIYAKRQYEASLDNQAASMDMSNAWTPGFNPGMGGGGGSSAQGGIQVAPFAQPYKNEIMSTLNNKAGAAMDSIGSIQSSGTTL
ncbi:MAG: hypothetical protein U1F57_02620 [bacterium]